MGIYITAHCVVSRNITYLHYTMSLGGSLARPHVCVCVCVDFVDLAERLTDSEWRISRPLCGTSAAEPRWFPSRVAEGPCAGRVAGRALAWRDDLLKFMGPLFWVHGMESIERKGSGLHGTMP